jgi:hypothetical protein
MTLKQFIRRLKKLSPPGRYDLSAVLIAADPKIPFRKLRRRRLDEILEWPLEVLGPRVVTDYPVLSKEIRDWLEWIYSLP